jgi:hypothetical protein
MTPSYNALRRDGVKFATTLISLIVLIKLTGRYANFANFKGVAFDDTAGIVYLNKTERYQVRFTLWRYAMWHPFGFITALLSQRVASVLKGSFKRITS